MTLHFPNIGWSGWLSGMLALTACGASFASPLLKIPEFRGDLKVDGRLDEVCYRTRPLVKGFVVAGAPNRKAPRTRAWLFWSPERLVFAFDCEDDDIVAAAESRNEMDVDNQDRVELFLWSGREADAYACIEIGARGAVHDYRARFYRQFDSAWSSAGWRYAVSTTAKGYRVEGEISREAMGKLGFHLSPGTRLRAGLFRADFASHKPGLEPTWITWVDARGPKPDFHVAQSFGEVVLTSKRP